MTKKLSYKEFKFKKGDEDWKVWDKPSDYIYAEMIKKRGVKSKMGEIKKPILVKITIIDDYLDDGKTHIGKIMGNKEN